MADIFITNTSPLTVSVKGELDTGSVAAVQHDFDALNVDLSGDLCFDLSELTYISSSGLRFLLGVKKRASAMGGTVRVEHMTEMVAKIFHLVGFDALFT
jgi:anti-anti-sigma factor